MNDALAPVRRQLMQQATSYAEHVVAEADASAAQVGRAAVEETERLLREARAQGEVDARDVVAAGHARARARARRVVLAARKQVYDQLVDEVRSQARAMAASRPELLADLREQARAALGADAEVVQGTDGTFRATALDRTWAWSPDAEADEVVVELGDAVDTLWSP